MEIKGKDCVLLELNLIGGKRSLSLGAKFLTGKNWELCGEKIGIEGCAQIIEMVLADVEEEMHGPAGD